MPALPSSAAALCGAAGAALRGAAALVLPLASCRFSVRDPLSEVVEPGGLEPPTSALQRRRSTS